MSIHLDDLYFGKVGLGEQELRSKLTLELAMHSAQQTQCMSPWACVTVAYFSAWLSIAFLKRGQNTHTHTTHTHTHTNTYTHTQAFVARIESIILSIFRVKAIDYQFRFLESMRST